jgi:N-acetylneuraminate synthase/N,N'-diacetyllegionaminate synthase
VGPGAPVFVIAEAGVAHFGEMGLARQLVELARDAAADAFKIQLFDPEVLIARRMPDWRERLSGRNLTLDQARELRRMCDEAGLAFIATAHDESRLAWLGVLDVAAVKIGSGERNNPRFMRSMAALGRPLILSTGMYHEDDVREAIAACADGGCDRLAVLHCVTTYPTPPADVNLAAMDRLKDVFPGPVGYSDHTPDGLAVLAAVARGARVVEKHITIRRNVPNAQDWKVSADRETFPALVADIRRVEAMIGDGAKQPAACEGEAMHWALKSLVAARDLPPGHTLTAQDVVAKRPGDGIPPNQLDVLVGRTLRRALAADDPVAMGDLE